MALVLRPLSIGEILDRTFSLYRNYFKLFVGIMVLPQLAIFATSLGMIIFPALMTSTGGTNSSAFAVGIIGFLISMPIYLAVYFAAIGTGQAATVYAVSQVYLERNTTIGGSYAFIRSRFWSIVGVVVLTFVAVMVGFVAFIVGTIFAGLFCSLAIPVTVLEGRDPIESIKRSFNLVKDDLGRIFVIMFVFLLLHSAISYMFSIPAIVLMAVLAQHGQPPIWVNSLVYLGGFISGCLIMPMLNIALSIAYYDERVRKEAFDMQFMMANIDRNAMAAGAVAAHSPLPPSV